MLEKKQAFFAKSGSFWERSKLLIPLAIYGIIYMASFYWLESNPRDITIIYSSIDSKIPFCEYFIVPYLLWFFYIAFAIVFFIYFNDSKTECIQMYYNLAIGMTLFIIISYVFPNGLQLRPTTFERDNIFVALCQQLWKADTSTNVFPSIHVYNSMAIFFSLNCCAKLRKHIWVRYSVFALTVSIVLSTMFLKQHSIIDVVAGLGLSVVAYLIIYKSTEKSSVTVPQRHAIRRKI